MRLKVKCKLSKVFRLQVWVLVHPSSGTSPSSNIFDFGGRKTFIFLSTLVCVSNWNLSLVFCVVIASKFRCEFLLEKLNGRCTGRGLGNQQTWRKRWTSVEQQLCSFLSSTVYAETWGRPQWENMEKKKMRMGNFKTKTCAILRQMSSCCANAVGANKGNACVFKMILMTTIMMMGMTMILWEFGPEESQPESNQCRKWCHPQVPLT